MILDKSCPGSRAVREPKLEYVNCPGCGAEVEIWTNELETTCDRCSGKVHRARQASCIDWCPHAKECVGPEVYARLKPGVAAAAEGDSPLDILKREHERGLDVLNLLRGAGLCLKLGSLTPDSPILERGLEHFGKVLDFFDGDLMLHFRREEEGLFPALEKRIGVDKSPTRLLLEEHEEVWRLYDQLKERIARLRRNGRESGQAIAAEAEDIARQIAGLLAEHIKKENESLLPLANGLLAGDEIEATARRMKAIGS